MMRDQFPLFHTHPELIYLDSAATTQKPKSVIDAITRFYQEEYATVHRSIYQASLHATAQYNATRTAAAHFLNAKHTSEIVFTKGTTDGLNLVAASYGSLVLSPGDEILLSPMEHHSNLVPWQLIAAKQGATLRFFALHPDGTLDLTTLPALLSSKTKIVALTHASNVTGVINPIKEIASAAHAVDAILVVDGAQAAPHLPIDVQALDADFYAFSAHKCYGPTGVGILYGKESLLQRMPPYQGGGDMIETVDLLSTRFQQPPLKFEAGTPPIASLIAFRFALEFLQLAHSQKLALHEETLLNQAREALLTLPGCRILGPHATKIPLLTFQIAGVHPLDLATLLDLRHIAIRSGHLCAQPLLRHFGLTEAARISFGAYNTLEEILQAIQEIHKITKKLSSI